MALDGYAVSVRGGDDVREARFVFFRCAPMLAALMGLLFVFPYPAVLAFVAVVPIAHGTAALWRVAFNHRASYPAVELGGALLAFGAPAFDLYMTVSHDPELTRETNAVVRWLFAHGHSVSEVYLVGLVAQMFFAFWGAAAWVAFVRVRSEVIARAAYDEPVRALGFLRAAMLGDGYRTPVNLLAYVGVMLTAGDLLSITGALSWAGWYWEGAPLAVLLGGNAAWAGSMLHGRDRLAER